MRVLIVFCLTAGIVSSVSAVAQTAVAAPSSASGGTTLKVTSRLTLVDVTVTDSKGRPVHGLTRADFAVKEDGKPQSLKNFEEYGTERQTTAPVPALPPNVFSNQLTSPPNIHAVNILLFDQVATGISHGLQMNPAILKDAKEASLNYLKTMSAETQVAILEMDGDGLHMVQGFTSNHELLFAAVNSITYQRVPESNWDTPQAPGLSGLPPEKPNYFLLCNAMNFQSAQALNALNQTAAFVSSIPGRKNLIWFTPGIPWLTGYPYFGQFDVIACMTDYTVQLQQVYGRLTSARVALYPIDPRGVLNKDEGSVAPPGLGLISKLFGVAAFFDNGSLDDVAKATGGKAHYNNDLAGALREDTATGADYYALSYVPPLSKYDGKHHTIEVKVDRPGLQLEYRRGYTSLDLEGPLLETEKNHGKTAPPKNSLQTAMGYGKAAATQLVFAVRAAPSTGLRKPEGPTVIGSLNAELKGKSLVRYSFDFDLPRDKITLVVQPDGTRKGSFEIAIVAYDVQRRVLNSLDEKHSFTLKADTVAGFLQKPFLVPVEIDLPPGNVSVRAGTLDLPSQEIGVVEIPLTVMAP